MQKGLDYLIKKYSVDTDAVLSPDGKTLAVGGRDRMGCVYFLTF